LLFLCIEQRWQDRQERVAAQARALGGIVDNTVNVSMNYYDTTEWPTFLRFRTLQEVAPKGIFIDEQLGKRVKHLADETTAFNPFLKLHQPGQSKADTKVDDQICKAVVNYLSSLSADGLVSKAMGLPVMDAKFVCALTNEKFGQIDSGHFGVAVKLRIIVVREDILKAIHRSTEKPEFEAKYHLWRWKVLKAMAKDYTDALAGSSEHNKWMLGMSVTLVVQGDATTAKRAYDNAESLEAVSNHERRVRQRIDTPMAAN